jgi:hypothetical protein
VTLSFFAQILSVFCLDIKGTKDDAKDTKAIVQDIISKLNAGDCLYPLNLGAIPFRNSHAVIGEVLLQNLQEWLSPPDPSTDYNIGLRDLHEETATWFLEDDNFQEWRLKGSLLWIHGKRAFLETSCLLDPDGFRHS